MWPYLICFIVYSILIYVSGKVKYKLVRKLIICIALIIPCILAGCRDLTIGTDVQIYLNPMHIKAQFANSFNEFLTLNVSGNRFVYKYELGFTLLVYLISNIFKDIHVLMFVIEALIIFPIYFGCKKIEPLKNKIWLCMFVYYCLFFNYGLNAMREFMGLSFAFYAICSYISKERNGLRNYIIFSLIAFFLHKSTVLSVVIVLIYKLLNNSKVSTKRLLLNNKKISISKIVSIIVIVLSFYLLFNLNIFNSLLYSMEGFGRYVDYYSGNVIFSINNFLRVLPMVLILILLFKKFVKKYDSSMFYTTIFCFAWIIFVNLNTVSLYGDRVSNIFKLMSIIIYPLLSISPDSKKGKTLITIIIILYVLYYFWYTYVNKGYHHTVPYIFG